jgi:hypothetical protein
MPKARIIRSTIPETRRLAPDTVWPEPSSRTAVVSDAPGRNTTSDATNGTQSDTREPVTHREGGQSCHAERSDHWREDAKGLRALEGDAERSHEHAQERGRCDLARHRPQDETDANREQPIPQHADGSVEPPGHRFDPLEPRETGARFDSPSRGVVRELIHGG